MPDGTGRFKGIAVPAVPWHPEVTDGKSTRRRVRPEPTDQAEPAPADAGAPPQDQGEEDPGAGD